MSKVHPMKSKKYYKEIEKKEERRHLRLILKEAKKIYFNKYGIQDGKVQSKRELNKIRIELLL